MQKIKVFIKKFQTKDGTREFCTATSKGVYLPLGDAESEVYYTIKLTKNGKAKDMPMAEGCYEIGYNSPKDIWVDKRPEMLAKHVVRVNAEKVVFVEPLKVKDEDLPF